MDFVEDYCAFCTESETVLSNKNSMIYFRMLDRNNYNCNKLSKLEFLNLCSHKHVCVSCAFKIERSSIFFKDIKCIEENVRKQYVPKKKCSMCNEAVENMFAYEKSTKHLQKVLNAFVSSLLKKDSKENHFLGRQFCLNCYNSCVFWYKINDSLSKWTHEYIPNGTQDNEESMKNVNTSRKNKRLSNKIEGDSCSEDTAKKTKKSKLKSLGSDNDSPVKITRSSRFLNSDTENSDDPTIRIIKKKISVQMLKTSKAKLFEKKRKTNIAIPYSKRSIRSKKRSDVFTTAELDMKLKHLHTVNNETLRKDMNLDYSVVVDKKMMFDIPYVMVKSSTANLVMNISDDEADNESESVNSISPKRSSRLSLASKKKEIGLKKAKTAKKIPIKKKAESIVKKPRPKPKSRKSPAERATLDQTIYNCSICDKNFNSNCDYKLHEFEHNKKCSPRVVLDNSLVDNKDEEIITSTDDKMETGESDKTESNINSLESDDTAANLIKDVNKQSDETPETVDDKTEEEKHSETEPEKKIDEPEIKQDDLKEDVIKKDEIIKADADKTEGEPTSEEKTEIVEDKSGSEENKEETEEDADKTTEENKSPVDKISNETEEMIDISQESPEEIQENKDEKSTEEVEETSVEDKSEETSVEDKSQEISDEDKLNVSVDDSTPDLTETAVDDVDVLNKSKEDLDQTLSYESSADLNDIVEEVIITDEDDSQKIRLEITEEDAVKTDTVTEEIITETEELKCDVDSVDCEIVSDKTEDKNKETGADHKKQTDKINGEKGSDKFDAVETILEGLGA